MFSKKKASLFIAVSILFTSFYGASNNKIYAYSNGSYFNKPAYTAKNLKVIDTTKMKTEEQTMIASLQGIISNKTSDQIYITDSTNNNGEHTEDGYLRWLNNLKDNHNIQNENLEDPWIVLDNYKYKIDGYILYKNGNSSINAACSLAGVLNAIPVEASIEKTAVKYGLKKVLDVSNKDEAWVVKNYWNKLNHGVVIEQKESIPLAMRDFAANQKALIFYDGNSSWRSSLMKMLDSDSVVLGWGDTSGGSENAFISNSGRNGVHYIAADWGKNLSVLSGFDSSVYKQNTHEEPNYEENVHYVCFMMSDGDNLQWNLGRGNSERWWGNSNRGKIDIGWSIAPSMLNLCPTVLDWYYKTKSVEEGKDNFVVGPSGGGFFFPGDYPSDKLDLHLQRLNETMGKTDMNSVMLLGYDDWSRDDIFGKYLSQSNIDGLFYFEWSGFSLNGHNGEIKFINNKPVISCSEKLFERKDELVGNLNEASTNVHSSDGYSVVYCNAWEPNIMDNIKYVTDRLNKNIKIVTPEEMIKLVNHNLKTN